MKRVRIITGQIKGKIGFREIFKNKRIVSLLLVVALLFGAIIPSSADNHDDRGILVTDRVVEEIALMWASTVNSEVELQVDNIIPLFEFDGSMVGYIASFFSPESTPFGYIVLNFSAEGFVDEFVVQENAPGLVESILRNADASDYLRDIGGNNVKLHRTLPLEYAVSVEPGSTSDGSADEIGGGTIIYGFHGEMTQEEFDQINELMMSEIGVATTDSSPTGSSNSLVITSVSAATWEDVFIDRITNYTTVDSKVIYAISNARTRAESEAKRYACGVQAMINIAQAHNMILPSASGRTAWGTTYVNLWSLSGTSTYKTENNIMYGLTSPLQYGSALKELGYLKNRSVNYSTNLLPSYSTFRNAVNASKSSIFRAEVGGNGHAVSVAGYHVAKNNSTGSTVNFLYVADGWNANVFKFINWSDNRFSNKWSVVLTIS